MKKLLLYLTVVLLLTACNSVKRSQKALYSGNYNASIDIAVSKLQKDRNKKNSQEYILILEDAFKKINERDKKRIDFLEKEANPENSREIFVLYSNLENIQNSISPLLPLYNKESGREVKFKFNDYSNDLIKAKQNFADYLYNLSKTQMQKDDKLSYRDAHSTLQELLDIAPNYRDGQQLLNDAHYFGTDFVFVRLTNNTNQFMPRQLEQDLLNFNTYGLDDFWTVYHTSKQRDIPYNFEINLEFRSILVSPERITERQIPLELEIQDGFTYQKDRRGNFVLDSLGNKIKIDKFIVVKGTLYETEQTKSLAVDARVVYKDIRRNQIINNHPLQTEFIFENVFATFRGDERVLSNEDRRILNNRFVPFPSNEQMLLDAGGDIKDRLSEILQRNKF
ncbi:MAG: hypothetical protein AUK33_02385 [Flavobacteriaceae bacterium CG2_30_34_30]|nr:hypothetical protein [Flavobacteriia bacterium]OIP51990.1 MAG: hypothetical protein AUK33_02385 [Flavobacteriaceae bacterium CG2_30_34_30]